MGKPCVVGAGELVIDEVAGTITVNGRQVRKGQFITLDGETGDVFLGKIETREPALSDNYRALMAWADEFRTVGVRANADTPHDAAVARAFGAEGIGLCRTEHMFFQGDRIDAIREMIVAETPAERRQALAKVEPYQRDDFARIFREMDGFPVTIRTLDPPLHEFLPREDAEIHDLARKMSISFERLKAKIDALSETNPMLGFRGCRLGIAYPEITEMQARAIFTAAKTCRDEGIDVRPEVMIPLVNTPDELRNQATIVRAAAAAVGFEGFLVGTMIEVPRAALVAQSIAEVAEFFSFGTNDLTQTTMGISRDDSARFVPSYIEKKILANDPFQVLDQEGVGQLVKLGIAGGRAAKPDLKIGVCGEHGGEPSSVEFFVRAGLNYVSCSPYRVPVARISAARAAIGAETADR
jgi:pyruvate,orthophosphate dikinase